MKKTIWKFSIIPDKLEIEMPEGAEILTVQLQDGYPELWAMVNPEAENVKRLFEVFATGQSIDFDMGVERKYISTFQQRNGLVFHVFERIN